MKFHYQLYILLLVCKLLKKGWIIGWIIQQMYWFCEVFRPRIHEDADMVGGKWSPGVKAGGWGTGQRCLHPCTSPIYFIIFPLFHFYFYCLFWHLWSITIQFCKLVWLADESSVTEMRIWSILLIKFDLKWCLHLRRSLFLFIPLTKCNSKIWRNITERGCVNC